MLSVRILLFTASIWIVQGQRCAGPGSLHAVVDNNKEYVEMESDSVFRLFGEDAPLARSAFLSREPTCRHSIIPLQKRGIPSNPAKILCEFESEERLLISPDDSVLYFFCVEPKGSSFGHLVKIPPSKSYDTVYILVPVLIVVLCMSATFSGLNLAIMSFSMSDLQLIQQNDSDKVNSERAGDVLRLRRHNNFVLCTIICGNCFCNTTITILINYYGDLFGFSEFFFVELVATILLLIFTEILPSLIFTKSALKYASKLQYFVIFTMILTFPISFPLSKLLDKMLRSGDDEMPVEVDSEQLEGMWDEGANENFNEMMNLLKKTVELRQKRAEDVMTPIEKVRMISDTETSFSDKDYAKGHSRLPVFHETMKDQICGVLTIKDLMLLLDEGERGLNAQIQAATLLSVLKKRTKHRFVLNTMLVKQFFSELQKGCTMALVVKFIGEDGEIQTGENFKVIGIITLEDYMEEIVGEIFDEKDKRDSSRKHQILHRHLYTRSPGSIAAYPTVQKSSKRFTGQLKTTGTSQWIHGASKNTHDEWRFRDEPDVFWIAPKNISTSLTSSQGSLNEEQCRDSSRRIVARGGFLAAFGRGLKNRRESETDLQQHREHRNDRWMEYTRSCSRGMRVGGGLRIQ